MITANFATKNNKFIAVEVSGHALFDNYGKDIVCAAVTSSLMMFANGVTEVLKHPAEVKVEENKVTVKLGDKTNYTAEQFLKSFCLHLNNLKEDYPNNINIIISEV